MTLLLDPDLTPVELSMGSMVDLACQYHPGVFAEQRLGFKNAPFHWEWYELGMKETRLAVIAPREHAKSEIFSVISTVHMALFNPGSWQYVFSATHTQGTLLMERIVSTMAAVDVEMVDKAVRFQQSDVIFSNYSRVSIAGAGKGVRGIHPDRIVGDDILTEEDAMSQLARRRRDIWWKGTVGPMAHPGTYRRLGWGRLTKHAPMIWYPPSKILLVGTPFHQLDLLMSMRTNPMYKFRRYDAEFEPHERINGTYAVEAG